MSGSDQDDVLTGGPLPLSPAGLKEETHLEGLADRFDEAMAARRAADADRAIDLLRGILRDEPRLAEPHLELAGILLDLEQPEEALEHAREAVRLLSHGAIWTEAVPAKVLGSLAWDTLGECLKQTADQDSVVFGPEERWRALMEEARFAFARATELDPDNEHASWGAFGMGVSAPAAEGGARWVRRAPEQDQPEGEEDEDLDLEEGDEDEDLAALLAGVLPDADLVELIRRQSAPPEPELVTEDDDQDDDPA
ncbi:MAG: hypothetical protein JNM72_09695 [Deltaproteobacteria bacterium]|nr:hypothetical protein [Deltaproteobacteria bacterium]